MSEYDFLKNTAAGRHWQRLGVDRRAGVAVPLFSVYSENSAGIGEIPDIALLIDWCKAAGMSLLQLLPLNDVGFRYTPYDAESTFALEPAYLSLERLTGVPEGALKEQAVKLRVRFPTNTEKVNYEIKKAKLVVLRDLFDSLRVQEDKAFQEYIERNHFWIRDYALFKALKDAYGQKNWEDWPEELKNRNPRKLDAFEAEHRMTVLFHQWVQYQLYGQFEKVHHYAQKQGVFLMGDLPFLVSRDSADVWANPSDFKLDLASGAPPDLYFAQGQRWGMPPYRWEVIAQKGYRYLLEKLRYAECFYDLYRIDHAVGIFRVWTIQLTEPLENHGYNGKFDPEDPSLWEDHGRKILTVMIENAAMLPCAEDLGVVPDCAVKVLGEFGIPGMDVQRWRRDWSSSFHFIKSQEYRPISIALTSTHDMDGFKAWWEKEVGTIDAVRFKRSCSERGADEAALLERLFEPESTDSGGRLRWKSQMTSFDQVLEVVGLSAEDGDFLREYYQAAFDERSQFLEFLGGRDLSGSADSQSSPSLVQAALQRANEAASIFAIQLFSDLLSVAPEMHGDSEKMKVNWPGTFGSHNWSARMPLTLEVLVRHSLNQQLLKMHQSTGRI